MKKNFAIALIIIGSFLEIYYYAFRFINDGTPFWLSIIIGIALTLFLSILTIMRNKKRLVYFLMVPLFIYSVFCTSAGQTFSLITVEKANSAAAVQAEYNLETVNDLKYQKESIQEEIKAINKRTNSTVKSLEDQYEWKNTYRIATERKQELETQLALINEKLNESRESAIINSRREEAIENENIYHFYGRLSNIDAEIIQLILHGALSIFIAFMAPVGIVLITSINPVKKKLKIQKKPVIQKQSINPNKIRRWVQVSWSSKRQGKGENIIPKETFMKFMKQREEPFTSKEYDIIKKVAQERNIVDKEKIIAYNEIEASRRIFEALK